MLRLGGTIIIFRRRMKYQGPPFSLCSCLDQSLRGVAVRNSRTKRTHPGHAFLLLSLSVEVEVEMPDPSGVSSH